jgi:uncharacterized protein
MDDGIEGSELAPTARSRVKRLHERGRYDFETIAQILDCGFVCHVGYVIDGQPFVTPTAYWREGDRVYWHGSSASRMLRTMEKGVEVCLTVAHIDGIVLARSAFHHSINYRSAMLFGTAHKIEDPAAKSAALERFVDRICTGRWKQLRPVTPLELKATTVLSMPISEGAAKIRTGPPKDDEEDYDWSVWAGVVPLRTVIDAPIADPLLRSVTEAPAVGDVLSDLGLQRENQGT